MTDRERKSMTWAGALLLAAAVFRFLVVAPVAVEPPLNDRPSIADSLIVAGDAAVEEKERRSRPFEPGETIDPNVAGDEELDRLPGVGPARALQIVQNREENGPFRVVEDLARVSGIGPASVERMRPFLRLDLPGIRAAEAGRKGRAAAVPGLARKVTASSAAGPERSAGSGRLVTAGGGLVNINRATAAELQAIPGIGPVIADRIVAYRRENGPFRQADELMQVPGVGERTFARIAPLVTVGR